ncbi:MAG: DUF2953 domain-containing protein [Pseudomonadota bacterium]
MYTIVVAAITLLAAAIVAICVPWVIRLRATTRPVQLLVAEFRPFTPTFPMHLRFHLAKRRRACRRADGAEEKAPSVPKWHVIGVTGSDDRMPDRFGRAIGAAPQLLAGLLRAFSHLSLKLDARVGLSDPADTGQLFGWISSFQSAYSRQDIDLNVQPDFSGTVLDGYVELKLDLVPIALLPPVGLFVRQVLVSKT